MKKEKKEYEVQYKGCNGNWTSQHDKINSVEEGVLLIKIEQRTTPRLSYRVVEVIEILVIEGEK